MYSTFGLSIGIVAFIALQVMAVSPAFGDPQPADRPAYLDPSRSAADRARDLVSRMTLDEKVSQMVDQAPAIERLGVPEYNWWNECLHGVARAGYATVFPQAIGLAATWNPQLVHEMAAATADEARAKHHEALRHGNHGRYYGLTMWSPNINIFRDPRWGRGQETYGEDPFLTSRMGVAFITGLQGDDPRYFKVISTPKHFAVHSGPEPDRHTFDAQVSERELREIYLPAFRAAIEEAHAQSVMCAYNRFRGEACCSSGLLLMELLCGEWGFDGYVVSDCGAIDDIYKRHKIVRTSPTAAAMAVKLGCDLNCGSAFKSLGEAVARGLVTETELDTALVRLFRARIRLGMFDDDSIVPYAQTPFSVNECQAHRDLALECARQSLVLLKNDDNVLPLSGQIKKLAIIGPLAKSRTVLVGNYNGTPRNPVTLWDGIRAAAPSGVSVRYAYGCDLAEGFVGEPETIPTGCLRADGRDGLRGEYFDNPKLEGEPIAAHCDETVNFDTQAAMQAAHADIPAQHYSVRWTGSLVAKETGDCEIGFRGDDGYRLYLDGKLELDEWRDQASLAKYFRATLTAGQPVPIRIEYYQAAGGACAQLIWKRANDQQMKDEAVALAAESDAAVLVMGLTSELEGEEMPLELDGFRGGDRTRLDLPATQRELIQAVQATGKPVVLVLCAGSALAVNWADQHVPAILMAWYPGQAGGTAVGEALFGACNPGGRLPVTFYKSVDDLPPFDDYSFANRTYRYFRGQPLYPFGHGLSYAKFEYANLSVSADQLSADDELTLTLDVTNVSKVAGQEVVQVYAHDVESELPMPIKTLQGSERVPLDAGQTKTVTFHIPIASLAYFDVDQNAFRVEPGAFELQIGASSSDIRLEQTITVQ